MPLINTDTLARFFDQAENQFSDDNPYLVDRVSLNIISGTATYELPDYVRSIRRVTYLGQKLDPLPRRSQRDVFQSATQQSKPFWFVYNNLGILPRIQLFPIPNQSIVQVANPWVGAGILAGCIVEFNRITDNIGFVMPIWIKRQLLKQFVAMKCFSLDGSNQNLKLAEYFRQRWELRAREFAALLEDVHSKPRKLVTNEVSGSNYFPGQPILPIDRFGTSVDEGT